MARNVKAKSNAVSIRSWVPFSCLVSFTRGSETWFFAFLHVRNIRIFKIKVSYSWTEYLKCENLVYTQTWTTLNLCQVKAFSSRRFSLRYSSFRGQNILPLEIHTHSNDRSPRIFHVPKQFLRPACSGTQRFKTAEAEYSRGLTSLLRFSKS